MWLTHDHYQWLYFWTRDKYVRNAIISIRAAQSPLNQKSLYISVQFRIRTYFFLTLQPSLQPSFLPAIIAGFLVSEPPYWILIRREGRTPLNIFINNTQTHRLNMMCDGPFEIHGHHATLRAMDSRIYCLEFFCRRNIRFFEIKLVTHDPGPYGPGSYAPGPLWSGGYSDLSWTTVPLEPQNPTHL